MKREILFRGKRKDNGEWVQGSYIGYSEIYGKASIYARFNSSEAGLEGISLPSWCSGLFEMAVEVDPETLGQFTGKNCIASDGSTRKIFEGDILRYQAEQAYIQKEEQYTTIDCTEVIEIVGVVAWSDSHAGWVVNPLYDVASCYGDCERKNHDSFLLSDVFFDPEINGMDTHEEQLIRLERHYYDGLEKPLPFLEGNIHDNLDLLKNQ